MREATTYVGLDVHKKDIAVCLLRVGDEVAQEWTVAHTKRSAVDHERVHCRITHQTMQLGDLIARPRQRQLPTTFSR